jgi:glycine cleavage system aminomethyltransferase T
MIALATLSGEFTKIGATVEIEITVEAVRYRVGARIVKTPFYSPRHKIATPV